MARTVKSKNNEKLSGKKKVKEIKDNKSVDEHQIDELIKPHRTLSVKQPVIHASKELRKSPIKKRNNVNREIKYFQNNIGNVMPRAVFLRIIRSRMHKISDGDSLRFSQIAIDLLQETYETYMSTLFESSYMCTYHGKRVTLLPKDIDLVKKLRKQ
ncbi:histone H3.1 [Dictyocoela muelleri]|nr:histone H3.1 [Dictyocoela muelleri]